MRPRSHQASSHHHLFASWGYRVLTQGACAAAGAASSARHRAAAPPLILIMTSLHRGASLCPSQEGPMADPHPVVSYSKRAKFDDVRDDLKLAIEGTGL